LQNLAVCIERFFVVMKEIFKDIPGYEGLYQVSNLGRVKSLERKVKHYSGGVRIIKSRFLKIQKCKKGYQRLTLSKYGNIELKKIHYLVAITFLNHKPCVTKLVVDHINNIKSDNRIDNLQLITNRENTSKDKINCTSKYTGVCWDKNASKWKSAIRKNKKKLHLGYFVNELDASIAYKNALKNID